MFVESATRNTTKYDLSINVQVNPVSFRYLERSSVQQSVPRGTGPRPVPASPTCMMRDVLVATLGSLDCS